MRRGEANLSEVLVGRVALVGLAEVEVVVLVGDDRLLRVEPVDEELDLAGAGGGLLGGAVGDGRQPGQVEGGGRPHQRRQHSGHPSHPGQPSSETRTRDYRVSRRWILRIRRWDCDSMN